jgi:hypothetical protein
MSSILVILTAGRRDYLDITIRHLDKHLKGTFSQKIIFDNSDGPTIIYSGYSSIKVPSFNLPYGAIRHSRVIQFIFNYIRDIEVENIVFFEEDWKLLFDVNVDNLLKYLKNNISQIRFFRKQNYNAIKINEDISLVKKTKYMFSWNPSIFKKSLVFSEYPTGPDHESDFGKKIKKNFLVYKNGIESVEHIGNISSHPNVKWDKEYNRFSI